MHTFYLLLLLSVATPPVASAQHPNPSPSPASAQVAPLLGSPGTAAQLLDEFARAWEPITSYSATVTLFAQKGARTQDAVFSYTFQKPATATAYEAKGSNAGVTLVWNGGDTVVAHRSGLLSFFKKTISLHDPSVTTIRGSSIDQLSFGAILLHAEQEVGTLSVAPGDVIDGVTTEAVTLLPANSETDGGLTREILELSPTTHLPVRIIGYEDTQLVRKIDFSGVKFETSH